MRDEDTLQALVDGQNIHIFFLGFHTDTFTIQDILDYKNTSSQLKSMIKNLKIPEERPTPTGFHFYEEFECGDGVEDDF
jgi:hypothetical protein